MAVPTFNEFRQKKYGGAAPSAGGSPTGGVDPETLRQAFGMMAVQNPKQAALLKNVYSFFAPTADSKKLSAKQGLEKQDVEIGLSQINAAREALARTGSGIGYTDVLGLRSKLPSWLGGYDKNATDTNSALSNVNTQLFKIAGTQFPKNEQSLLGGIVLGLDKNKQANESSLNTSEQRLRDRLDAIMGTLGTSTTQDNRPSLDEIFAQ